MPAHDSSHKAAVTVSEMADLCEISRSRFYELMKAGVFPKPVQHPSSSRPLYDLDLIAKCLEIRATGVGLNGPVLFNRKIKRAAQPRPRQQRLQKERPTDPLVQSVLDVVIALGLPTTAKAVSDALSACFPNGTDGHDLGAVGRAVFLHLQGKQP